MTDAIIVEHLSKQYEIGLRQSSNMFREALVHLLTSPLRRRQDKKNTIWALQDVSFSVRQGDVVGIIGRNGAGKSTLLKLLSKITYPTSGTVNVRGRLAALLEVGTGFHEELTGRENVYLNGSILGMTRREIDAKLDSIVAFSDVEKFIDTPIKRYSSGMRLRLGFAVAAHLDPDVLLVDEVLAVGDAGFQKKCMQAMGDLQSSGRTVLFVSHNMAAVENLCPRAIWIDGGRVREDGSSKEVIKSYLATFGESTGGGVDLGSTTSRLGSGEIRYKRVEFLDKDRQAKGVIQSGDRFIVRLHFEAAQSISNPIFGMMIYTELGTRVTDTSTWHTGCEVPTVHPGEGYVDLEIDFLNLQPTRYFLTLYVAKVGGEYYDRLERCACLDVEPSDFYGSGKGITHRAGVIFLPCRWHVEALRASRGRGEEISEAVDRRTTS